MTKKLAYVSSPLRGDVKTNIEKAREYCKIVSAMGLIPMCPHLMTYGWLDDSDDAQRRHGMEIALELLERCDVLFICGDTISEGMQAEKDAWGDRPVIYI